MRSKDYVWSSACARGGSYIDSPAGYDGVANLRAQAWDPTMLSGRWTVMPAADRFIDALCNSVAKFVVLEVFVNSVVKSAPWSTSTSNSVRPRLPARA
jgi:hypothetical protein